ncbi:hypothetical protein [Nocardia mangyaensis]|uniref:hypothetical protein n=1 Tax=Nocardia mangyaensis TaxID=2213200 RepID=UPI002676208A|nr:hypothetical protein [Nocardia mangyaensis]MDO3649946.1 hypothetical protein [Nocardia mangyaensis]
MSSDRQSDRHGHHPDGFAEFTEELRLLAEVLLARVEPVLRRTAADGQADLGGCAWCPVCAAAALVRGEHHDVVAALAEHGTSMVTVLREALAGVPVEPLLPEEWAEHAAGHPNSRPEHPRDGAAPPNGADGSGAPGQPPRTNEPAAPTRDRRGAAGTGHRSTPAAADESGSATTGLRATAPGRSPGGPPPASGTAETPHLVDPAGRAHPRRGTARGDQTGTPRPRRVDEYAAPRQQGAPARATEHRAAEAVIPEDPSPTGLFPAPPHKTDDTAHRRRTADADRVRAASAPRSRYVDIPVTIRG